MHPHNPHSHYYITIKLMNELELIDARRRDSYHPPIPIRYKYSNTWEYHMAHDNTIYRKGLPKYEMRNMSGANAMKC